MSVHLLHIHWSNGTKARREVSFASVFTHSEEVRSVVDGSGRQSQDQWNGEKSWNVMKSHEKMNSIEQLPNDPNVASLLMFIVTFEMTLPWLEPLFLFAPRGRINKHKTHKTQQGLKQEWVSGTFIFVEFHQKVASGLSAFPPSS